MRAIRTALFASSIAAIAACGGGGSKDVDAMVVIIPDAAPDAPPDAFEQTFDLSCVGNAQPAAAANVTLSGFAAEVVVVNNAPDVAPAHNATVQVCKASSTTCMNTDELYTFTTPASGCPATGCAFASSALPTGGTPLDVYGKVSKGTNRPTYIYPAAPLVANVANAPGIMLTPTVIGALAILGINQDANKAIMLLAVTDCANMPITEQVTLSVKQGGTAVVGTDEIDLGSLDPSLAGTYAIFNVPTGPAGQPPVAVVTEVSGTYKTTALRTHEVRVFPGGTTATQLRPGF